MRSVARINAYYAIVDAAGQKIIDWQAQAKEPLIYIYHHADARLLVCQESPDDQDDCSVVREIDPQFDMNSLGLKPTPVGQTASRLIGVLDQLFHMDLQTGAHHYGRAHAIRLAYLSLYLGEISQLSYRDTFLLIYCSFLADLGHKQPDDTSLTGEGAEAVLKTGQLGHIDYFYGVHVRPQQEIAFGQCEAIIPHGSTQTITGTITGQTFHAGMPEYGHNVIEAFTRLNEKVMAIDLDTNVPYSAKATIFKAGDSTNIIPGTGTFALDLRAQTNDTMADLTKIVDQIIADVQDDHFGIRTNKTGFSPAAIPSKNAIGYMSQAITAVLGQRGLVDSVPSAGGDDFHFYAYSHPEIQSTMLGLGCDLTPGLHVPSMTFKTDALFYGAKILIDAISRTA